MKKQASYFLREQQETLAHRRPSRARMPPQWQVGRLETAIREWALGDT